MVLDGLRPIDPYRDLKAVTDLIVVAFGDRLDPAGQLALAHMRRVARRRGLMRLFYWPEWDSPGAVPPGFVWVEHGQVVGNVSLRPALERGGYLIGNVCVHPDWRRRGIARALMEAALTRLSARGGRWAGLEVRADSPEARRMYEHLGFREAGRTMHLLRPAGLPVAVSELPSPDVAWRRGGGRDSRALLGLARATVPVSLHALLELRSGNYEAGWGRTMDTWLAGKRESWWVAEQGGRLCGAVRALRDRRRAPDRLEVLVREGYAARLGRALALRGVLSLSRSGSKLVEAVVPCDLVPVAAALQEVGFRTSHVLVQMRQDLGQAVSARRV